MKPHNAQFAPFFRRRRAELGLSIQQLAERLSMSRSSVHQWESGENIPGAARLPQVASALEMSYEDFLAGAGFAVPEELPNFAPYFRAKYSGLPEEAQAEAEAWFAQFKERYGAGGEDAESDH